MRSGKDPVKKKKDGRAVANHGTEMVTLNTFLSLGNLRGAASLENHLAGCAEIANRPTPERL